MSALTYRDSILAMCCSKEAKSLFRSTLVSSITQRSNASSTIVSAERAATACSIPSRLLESLDISRSESGDLRCPRGVVLFHKGGNGEGHGRELSRLSARHYPAAIWFRTCAPLGARGKISL